jgi:putative peptidoglycan lipid II flippase
MSGQYSESLLVMTRIMLLQPIILALSGLYGSYIQVYKKFFIYAISPIVYNLGIISGVVFLYPLFGMPGLVLGVIIGALLHLAIQIPTILEKGPCLKFTLYPN